MPGGSQRLGAGVGPLLGALRDFTQPLLGGGKLGNGLLARDAGLLQRLDALRERFGNRRALLLGQRVVLGDLFA